MENYNNVIVLRDKTEIYYKDFGRGEDLILLHGNDGDMTYFDYQVGYFKKYFHTILIDFRDHGFSTNTKDSLTFDMMADDLREVYDRLKIKKAHVLGFSDGANLALVFNKKYPGLIKKLILNAPNARFDGVNKFGRALFKIENFIFRILPFFNRLERVKGLLLKDLKLSKDDLRDIGIPTIIIVGSRDIIRLSHIRGIAQNIRNSKLYIIKNAGHKLARDLPEVFNKLVIGFLKGA